MLAALLSVLLLMPARAEESRAQEALQTGADPDAVKVATAPVAVTIAGMNSWHDGLPYPEEVLGSRSGRIAPYELQVYRVSGTMTWCKGMRDGDLHFVVSDGSGSVIVAELPDPGRIEGKSVFLDKIRRARAALEARVPFSKERREVGLKVEIEGPALFAQPKGKSERARNGVRIHPVLSVKFL